MALPTRYEYTSPARVRVLVVPAGPPMDRPTFEAFEAVLAEFNEIRLLDVTPMNSLKYFNPQSFPGGRLVYEFQSTVLDAESMFLYDFEPFRKTFVVLGIAQYDPEFNGDANAAIDELKQLYPSTIVQNCIVFNTPTDVVQKLHPPSDHSLKSVFFCDTKQRLETIMCQVSLNFLCQLDAYVVSYQNITLRLPVSITDSNSLTKAISRAQKRLSSGGVSVGVNNDSKIQVRNNGRHSKLLGSFYLLAGKYTEALAQFTDALLYLRKADDLMWLGSALEGVGVLVVLLERYGVSYTLPTAILATVLQVKAARRLSGERPATRRLSGEKSPRTSMGSLSSSSVVGISGGSPGSVAGSIGGSIAGSSATDLALVAVGELVRLISAKVNYFFQSSTSDFENVVPDVVYIESVLRNVHYMVQGEAGRRAILAEIDKIFSLQLVDLGLADQCRIYSAVASVYNELGMHRKKAFMLRTLLVAVLKASASSASAGTGAAAEAAANNSQTQVVRVPEISGIKSVVALLFESYGVEDGGWHFIQVQMLRTTIQIFEAVRDYGALVEVYCLALTRYLHCLPLDDQVRLKAKYDEISKLKLGVPLPYWDERLVRDVRYVPHLLELTPGPLALVPGEGAASQERFKDQDLKDLKDLKERLAGQWGQGALLVCGETGHLQVVVQNPFSFDIEINGVAIDGVEVVQSGVRCSGASGPGVPGLSKTQSRLQVHNPKVRVATPRVSEELLVPARSVQQLVVPFRAKKVGKLVIEKVEVAVGQCDPQTFHTEPVEIQVIETQPELSLVDVLVNNSWLMLLEGERYQFSIALTNTSSQAINYLSFSYWDLTIQAITSKLNNTKGLNAIEVYELEWYLLELRSFTILNKAEIHGRPIKSHEEMAIQYEVYGKKNMREMKMILEYSSNSQFLKSIEIPLNVTVVPSVELINVDVLLVASLAGFGAYERVVAVVAGSSASSAESAAGGSKSASRGSGTAAKGFTGSKSANKASAGSKSADGPIEGINGSVESTEGSKSAEGSNGPAEGFEGAAGSESTARGSNGSKSADKGTESAAEGSGGSESASKGFKSAAEGSEGSVKGSEGTTGTSGDLSDYCLLVLDVRNSWSEELAIEITFDGQLFLSQPLKPRTAERCIIPVRRVALRAFERIPSLRNRQYVKDYLLSEAQELEMKQHFWLRQHLLERLEGRWTAPRRSGTINFRNMKLNHRMISTLMYPKIKLAHEIYDEDGERVRRQGMEFVLQTEQFYNMRSVVTNYSEEPVEGVLRHVQSKDDKRLLVNGLLQSRLPRAVEPGGAVVVEQAFVVLEHGEYEWGAVLETSGESGLGEMVTSREPVYIVGV